MRRNRLAVVLALIAGVVPTSAWADGGQSIAAAPPVAFGQQEFGSTATGAYLHGGCGAGYRSFWALPVMAGDQVTIDWESAVPTVEMVVAPVGVTDYNMFASGESNLVEQALAGNGKNNFEFTAPQTGTMPLWFRTCETTPGPYAFVATDQHVVNVSLMNRLHIKTNSEVWATAALASGAPVPNGLSFTLTAKWSGNGSAQYTATSLNGGVAFHLALPREAEGQRVSLTVSRPADPQFLAATSAALPVKVARPRAQPSPKPAHKKPLICRKGFKKRKVRGKERCVRFERHRH